MMSTLEERIEQYLKIRDDQDAAIHEIQLQLERLKSETQAAVFKAYVAAFLTVDLTREEIRNIPHMNLADGSIVLCEGRKWRLQSNSDAVESERVIRTVRRPGAFFAFIGEL